MAFSRRQNHAISCYTLLDFHIVKVRLRYIVNYFNFIYFEIYIPITKPITTNKNYNNPQGRSLTVPTIAKSKNDKNRQGQQQTNNNDSLENDSSTKNISIYKD